MVDVLLLLSEAQCVLVVSLMTSDLSLAKQKKNRQNKHADEWSLHVPVSSQTSAQRPEQSTSNPLSKATSLCFDIQMCVFLLLRCAESTCHRCCTTPTQIQWVHVCVAVVLVLFFNFNDHSGVLLKSATE